MENSFKSILDNSKSLLILLPTKPYFDQVAAGLSLFLSLRELKEVKVSCPSPMTVEFNRLVGINKVTQELGSKNLIIKFADYKASDIERVSYDIEDGQFKLTVIPKSQINPPSRDQVNLSLSGVSSDSVIVVGGANESHFPALSSKDLAGVNIIHIGTRDLSLPNKNVTSFARPSSSVSEIVANLIKESGLNIDADIATNLLMGIEQGSSSFTSSDVSAQTFALISELMNAGGKRQPSASSQRRDYPPGATPQTVVPVQQGLQKKSGSQPQEEAATKEEEPPKEWFEPKIFKGTSIK